MDIREKYELFLEHQRGLKQATLWEYKRCIRLFCDEAKGDPWVPIRTQGEYENMIRDIAARLKYVSSSRQRLSKIVQGFGEFAYRERVVDRVPYVNTFKRNAQRRMEFFTEREFQQVTFNPLHSITDLTMMLLLWDCGMRKGELLALNVGDVNITKRLIRVVNNKTGRVRFNPIREFTRIILSFYLLCLGVQGKLQPDQPLFYSRAWNRLSHSELALHMQEIEEVSQIRVFAHKFRHSLGGRIIEAGGDLKFVQELLGHENLNTTAIYTHFETANKRNQYDQLLEPTHV